MELLGVTATNYGGTAEMHKQTDHAERPKRAGHGGKMASRLGSGGDARSGVSPDASTYAPEIVWLDRTERRAHPAQPEPPQVPLVEYVRADLVRAAMPVNADDQDDQELYRLAKVLGMTPNA